MNQTSCFICSVLIAVGFSESLCAQSNSSFSPPNEGRELPADTLPVNESGRRGLNPSLPSLGEQQHFYVRNPTKQYRPVMRTRTVTESHMEEIPSEELKRLEEFQSAVAAVRKSAESPEEKTKARTTLEALVTKQMDRDLESREKQLAEIEAQAKTLREQLEQRKSSKTEFVKLILLMIENPAAGMGLPPEWMNSLNPSGTFGVSNLPSQLNGLPTRESEQQPSSDSNRRTGLGLPVNNGNFSYDSSVLPQPSMVPLNSK